MIIDGILINLGSVSGNTQGCYGPAGEGYTSIYFHEDVYGC